MSARPIIDPSAARYPTGASSRNGAAGTAAAASPDWAALDASVRRWLGRRAPRGLVDDLAQETLLRVHR
ncbi:MAG: hypothetical protein REI11_17095, partial [Patulibacter sp.]|nr:hypothetical protein [Patulibacter sp.]